MKIQKIDGHEPEVFQRIRDSVAHLIPPRLEGLNQVFLQGKMNVQQELYELELDRLAIRDEGFEAAAQLVALSKPYYRIESYLDKVMKLIRRENQ